MVIPCVLFIRFDLFIFFIPPSPICATLFPTQSFLSYKLLLYILGLIFFIAIIFFNLFQSSRQDHYIIISFHKFSFYSGKCLTTDKINARRENVKGQKYSGHFSNITRNEQFFVHELQQTNYALKHFV